MRLVLVESPYKGNNYEDLQLNIEYARKAMRDCLLRQDYPFASHLLYTQEGILDDTIAEERTLGIDAGLGWGKCAEATMVYYDRGISKGMAYGINRAIDEGRLIQFRSLDEPDKEVTAELLQDKGLSADIVEKAYLYGYL